VDEDPLNLVARAEFAVTLRAAGHSEDADQGLRHLIALEPDFWFPYFVLAVNLAISGQWEESAELCERAYQIAPWFKPNVGCRAALLKRAGQDAEAGRLFDSLTTDRHYDDPSGPAMYYLVLGDLDGTADWAEKAVAARAASGLLLPPRARQGLEVHAALAPPRKDDESERRDVNGMPARAT
jgi:tetratricopeptide (TPR) repeat protein